MNTKHVGDITSLPPTGGTFLYLATVTDLVSRRLAGWAIADHMRADLGVDALHAANGAAASVAGVTQSMSAVGSSADNALAELLSAACKREILQGRRAWATDREAHLDLVRWLHRCNAVPRHSSLAHRSPSRCPAS